MPQPWSSFVALGDSFTEGLDDVSPDGDGYRGWADLVADVLAAHNPDLRYANLAVRGRLFTQVQAEQVPPALAMRPDLVTFAAGGNDVLRRRFDIETLRTGLDEIVGGFRSTGARVVLFVFADVTSRLPARRLIGSRSLILKHTVHSIADRHDADVVDLSSDPVFGAPHLWSDDRLHLSTAGHQRVAAKVLTTLNVQYDPAWLADPPPAEPLPWLRTRTEDARWVWRHLTPWVRRRLAGRSSGDTVHAKRPVLLPFGHR